MESVFGIMPSYLYLNLAQVIREHSTNKHRVPNTISVSINISHNMESIYGRGLRHSKEFAWIVKIGRIKKRGDFLPAEKWATKPSDERNYFGRLCLFRVYNVFETFVTKSCKCFTRQYYKPSPLRQNNISDQILFNIAFSTNLTQYYYWVYN